MMRSLVCDECRDERLFEQPPCGDGHDGDCPDWCCVDCGSALVIGTGATSSGPAARAARRSVVVPLAA